MEKERKQKNFVIVALLVTVMSLSIAFAATLSSKLQINGTANISKANWKVYFSKADVTDGSIQPKTDISVSDSLITYTVDLVENKYFEFTATIKNDGTYSAKLNKLTLAGIPDNLTDIVTYTTSGLTEGSTIDAGSSATITVKVAMGEINNDNISLFENETSLTLTLVADFIQAD